MADYSIQLGVTVDTSGVQSQINRIKPDPIELDVQVNTRTLQTQINNIRTTPVEVNVRLNDANALAQIANIRQQLQNLNNINVNIGGNGRGGGRRQVDDVTQAYRELMGVLGELNSKRLNLNGLTASSPQSSQKIQTLRLQIEQLENEYNNLINSFNAQGIQFTADQWNELETTMARVGRQIDVVQAGMSDKTAINNQTQAYRELLSVAKEIGNLEINITKLRGQDGNTNQIAELENHLNTLRATYQQLVTTMDTPLTNEQWSSIYTQVAQTSDKLEQLRAKIADAQADVAKGINIKLNDGSFNNDLSNITGRFDRIKEKTQEVKAAFDGFKTALSSMQTAAANNDIEGLIKANQDYERALKAVKNQLDINERAQRASIDSDKLEQAKNKLSLEMSQWIKDNSAAVSQFGGKVQALQAQIQSADGATLNNLKSQFTNVKKEAELAGKTGQTFGTKIKEKFSQFSAYFSVASVFMYATQAMKSMFEQVKSIDTAMTELKKVTDETDASYDQFLTNAASKAKEIGTTIDGLVTSTADFARLGYDFDQAVGLAEVANIYTVVGDEINGVEDATESLISTMAAFKSEMGDMSDAEFALSIVDKFNEVSNNFAISSGGIGEALQRSASSLATANNTLDESISLITAANVVVQDEEKVGNALKTISLRIRGATTELEEASLDTDGMAESTAKLREEILALSGVDIMLNADEFKSTYQIIDELADKWQDLTDIQQASITELMAGKHQANIFSSLIENFDTAREVLETSANSAGSAMAEHEKWSQSLEAKLTKLKSTWQSLSQSFLSSDFLKGGVDVITKFVDVLDTLVSKVGVLPTLLTGFTLFKSFGNKGIFRTINTDLDGFTNKIGILNKSFAELSQTFSFGRTGAGGFKDFFRGMKSVGNLFNGNALSKTDLSSIQAYNDLIDQCVGSQTAWYRTMQNASPAAQNLVASANGGKVAMQGLTVSTNTSRLAMIGLQAAAIAMNAALTMGISALISLGINILDKWIVTADELAEKVDEVTSKYKEQYEELQKLKGDYDTTNESSMVSKYAELSKGVDSFGKNLSLTADEYSEYQDIVSTIAGQFPSLVAGYDSQGNAILSCADNVGLLTEKYEELIHAQNREVLVNNAKDIDDDFQNAVKDAESDTEGWFGWGWTRDIGLGSNKLSLDAAEIYKNIVNSTDAVNDFRDAFADQDTWDSGIKLAQKDVTALADLLEDTGFERKYDSWFGSESDEEYVIRALEENRAVVKDIIDQYYADLEKEIEGKKSQVQAALSEAFDISDSMYYGMSDTMKNIAYQVANGFDFAFFADLEKKGISVQEYVNNMLDQLNALSKNDNATIEAAFNLKTQFNGGEISYGEYVEGLENTGSLIDNLVSSGALEQKVGTQIKLSLGLDEEGLVANYKALTNRLKEIGLSEIDAESLLDSLSAQELSVMTQIIPEIDADTTKEQLQALIDKEMVLQGLNFDLDLEVESASIESLNTALAESVSATGLSSESIDALKSRYADLEAQGWDLSSMFEETSHGIHINRNELSKFENELSSQKLSEVNNDLAEMKAEYDKLGEAIKNCTDPAKKAELFNDRQSLAKEISEAATLASQYQALTSAYNDWLAAEEAGNERDMYENVISGFETVKDELSRGWADDSTIEFLEMITGRTDLAGKSGKELKEVYDSLDKSIKYLNKDGKVLEDTGYSVRDFFTVDDEGNSTSKGVYNFLDAVGKLEEEAFGGKDIVKRDGKGNIIGFDFELAGGDEAIAEALGVSEELVQIMVRAADDAGFVVSMDGTYKQLADLEKEAKAATNVIKELFGEEYTFDFNTSNIDNLTTQLEKAKELLHKKDKDGEELFWNDDGTFNFDAEGATEAMTIVSTLQAKLDSLTQEQYGIGLTVEDKELEEPLENLQDYGDKIAKLNQLELNPKTNAEEIEKINGELDDIAEYFAGLDTDTKIKIGLEADDGIEEIRSKIENGEVKIPTTLDIQTNMDKNIEDLVTIGLYQSGLIDDDEVKVRLGIELDPEVSNPESVKEEVETSVPKNLAEDSGVTVKTPVTLSASSVAAEQFLEETGAKIDEVVEGAPGQQAYRFSIDTELQAGEVKTDGFFKKIWEGIKGFFSGGSGDGEGDSGVATGAEGKKEYSIGSVDVTVDEVDTSNVEEKTSEAIESESSGTETVEKEVKLELQAGDYIDNLSEFKEIAEELSELDSNISATVTANIEGNVLEAEGDMGKLVTFAEGVKELQDAESSYITVAANLEGNVTEKDNLKNLKTFAEGVKELDGAKSSYITVNANIEGNVLEKDNLKRLSTFAEGAKELDGAKSSYITVTANLDGNIDDAKNLDNLAVFAEGAKALKGTESTYVSVTANLEGNLDDVENINKLKDFADGVKELKGAKDGTTVTATAKLDSNLDDVENLDNLKTFAEGVKELQNIKEKNLAISVTANLEGTLNDHKDISNLAEFVQNAKDLKDVKDSKVTITASLNGNLLEKTKDKIDNLASFAEAAKELKGAEDTTVSVTASLNGNFLEKTKDKLDNLKTFAEGAKALKGAENATVSVVADASGNVFEKADSVLHNLDTFAKGAKALQDVEGSNVSVTANVNGNLASWSGSLSDLAQFAENAKKLQGVKSSNVSVNANISGNVNSDSVSDLERFASVVGALPSQAVTISVKASIDTANINSATDLLSKAANSGLFKDYNANIKVTYQKDSSEVDNYNPEDLTRKVTYDLDASAVYAFNPPNLTRTVTYYIQTVGGAGAGGGGSIDAGAHENSAYWSQFADGTAHADGTAKSGRAFKSGDWRTKDSGIALMGEVGREIIVRDGRFYTVGDDGAGFFPYKKGDIIFNHKQTEELLKNGYVTSNGGRGKAYAEGTAFSSGSGGGFWGNDTIYASSSKSSSTSSASGADYSSDSEENQNEVFDWIEKLLERFERAIDSLDEAANNIYKSFDKRNTSLSDEIAKVQEQISNQQKAYDRYMAEADYVGKDGSYDLTEEWRQKIRDGDFDIDVLNDEKLIEYIGYYEEWYEKALDCQEAIQELEETLSSLYALRVENVATEYEGILGVIEHEKNMLEEYINQSETQAWLVSEKYYDALASNERETIAELQNQKAEMLVAFEEAMASGTIDEYSESWYEIVSSIDEVTLAIAESQTALLEYEQTIQQLSWEVFDLLQDKIASVTDETEFLIDLLSSNKIYDDNGQLTDEGKATMGLHAVAYNTYMYQAEEAASEIEKLKKELAEDPYDTELEERYREMISLQQEYILNAQQEKEAIKDLVSEGFDAELDALDERIEKYKENLDSARDLYEYNKKVQEQAEEIANLEKQRSAYLGDTSEEGKAKLQQIEVSLKEAKNELAETEYDKLVDDTSALLDDLYLEYETLLNERLDNLDYLVEQMIEEVNSDASIIGDTIRDAADSVGYTLTDSMQTIWNEDATNTKNVITTYGDKFVNAQTTTNAALNAINTNLQNMINQLNKTATTNVKSASTSSAAKSSSTKTTTTTKTTTKKSGGDGTPKIGDRVKYVDGIYYYDSQGKKPLGSHNKGEYVYITNINKKSWATHPYHISTGNKLGKGDLGWLKLNQLSGYSIGKKKFLGDEYAWTQEDGQEYIIRPSDGAILTPIAKSDSVLTSAASNNIWNMANSPAEFIKDNLNLGSANVPNNSNVQSNYTQNFDKVIFNMPNVHGYNELLSEMQKDPKFEKLILSMTFDQVTGKSSLAKGKSIR